MKRLCHFLYSVITIHLIASVLCFSQILHNNSAQLPDAVLFKVDSNSVAEYEAYIKVVFIGNEVIVGRNNSVSGEIIWIKSETSDQFKAQIIIDAGKFTTDNETRDEDVREILEVNLYPEIRFELFTLEGFNKLGSGEDDTIMVNDTVIAIGVLMIYGITKEIQFTARIEFDDNRMTVEGSAQIKFSDFNIEPPTAGWIVKRASDELTIKVHIFAERVK